MILERVDGSEIEKYNSAQYHLSICVSWGAALSSCLRQNYKICVASSEAVTRPLCARPVRCDCWRLLYYGGLRQLDWMPTGGEGACVCAMHAQWCGAWGVTVGGRLTSGAISRRTQLTQQQGALQAGVHSFCLAKDSAISLA